MKKTKTCPSCGGSGRIASGKIPNFYRSFLCPRCLGRGVIEIEIHEGKKK